MNPKKNNRVLKKSLIDEGLAERDEAAKESEREVVVSAPLLNVSEAARYLGIGRKALYRLIEWGEVDAVRAAGSLRVEMRSLEALKSGRRSYSV